MSPFSRLPAAQRSPCSKSLALARGIAIRQHFRSTRGEELPEVPNSVGVRFGRFGAHRADEVLLVTHALDHFELHCHGGRMVVEWILSLLKSAGATANSEPVIHLAQFTNPIAAALLPFARTVRTASILLDQAHGAYDRAIVDIDAGGPDTANVAAILRSNVRVGKRLVEPWKIAIAGATNAGKSTLLNALAGFTRSVVSTIAGTTRDAVSVSLAFDGWPADVVDTAGLRDTSDSLEREGIGRTVDAVSTSDLCLWVVDVTGTRPRSIQQVAASLGRPVDAILVVFNKCDLIDVPGDEVTLSDSRIRVDRNGHCGIGSENCGDARACAARARCAGSIHTRRLHSLVIAHSPPRSGGRARAARRNDSLCAARYRGCTCDSRPWS